MNESIYLPGPLNFILQSVCTADESTFDNTDAALREQPIHRDLRDKIIKSTSEEGSKTNGRDIAEALEDSETEDTDRNGTWTTVVRRRKNNVVMGSRKTDFTFKNMRVSGTYMLAGASHL